MDAAGVVESDGINVLMHQSLVGLSLIDDE